MSKSVLMVEDFPIMQKFYKEALEKAGYTLEVVGDGEQALAKVVEKDYDIILLDLLLPKVNGIEFLEKYSDRPASTHVIILSDFTDPGRVQRARELGVRDYLVKSEFPPSELVKKLDSMTS
ncbi:MAG TPA: response regulator [Candidatus Saccharimonadales bacterium]